MPDSAEDTLQKETVEPEPEGAVSNDAGGDGEPFFLEVDDRHRYRTKEDAIRAISEAGRRISELSLWESKVGKAYGDLTPDEVSALLDEFIELSEKNKKAPPESPSPRDPQALAQEEANLRWLKAKGYLTKDELDAELKALRDELAELKTSRELAEQERFNRRVEEGEAYVRSLVKEAKLPEAIGEKAIRYITGCLSEANDPDGKLFEQFLRGGQSMREVLKSLFEDFNNAITLAKANAMSAYQQGKEKSVQSAGKTLPKGSGGSAPAAEPPESAPDVHDKAWEIFQAAIKD